MLGNLSVEIAAVLFGAAALVVAIVGTRMAGLADRIADRTGLGEAVVGGVLLGMTTSISGTVVSFTAAMEGMASLAFANAVGGIAAQTAFLAVGDLTFRRANLEHAAAELANVFQAVLLVLMLAVPLLAFTGPEISFLGLHPVSYALPVIYALGVRATAKVREMPMWRPVRTPDTRQDTAEEDEETARMGSARLYGGFALSAAILAAAGFVLARTGATLSDALGLSETIVGALMTAVATSLPELVTTLAAIRRGALDLAVGGIIGGNAFDVLFLTLADAGYRGGSIYHAVGPADLFWLVVGIAMTAVLLLGLVLRERQGPARIGFESALVLAIYAGAIAVQATRG